MQVKQARADSNRVFELMVYHTMPGKAAQYLEKTEKGYNVDEVYMRPTDFSALR